MPHFEIERYIGKSKSNKIRRAPILVNYLADKLDSQEIRRLCRYYTLDPLAPEALDYDGNFVEQPDLRDSLRKPVMRDKVSVGAEDKVIFNEVFSDTIASDNKIVIYVYPSDITFSKNSSVHGGSRVGFLTIKVDIVYPIQLNELEGGMQRVWSIACLFMDEVEDLKITDPKVVKEVGDLIFEFKEVPAINAKLAPSTNYAVLSLPLVVSYSGDRASINKW